jgi:Ser/Thr protein kinase RdoA (MazF antagonist)
VAERAEEGVFDEMLQRAYSRVGLGDLPPHLEGVYGIDVAAVEKLDVGVFRVDRRDGQPWVARVFPSKRSREAVDGDVAALRHVDAHGFPAERLASDSPVSVLHGQPVLVTDFIPSQKSGVGGKLAGGMGAFLARLHRLPLPSGPANRPAGALHHFAEGTRDDELKMAQGWLDQIESRVRPGDRRAVDRLRAALGDADGGAGLPVAFLHPDPVPKNIIRTADGGHLVDWTGAGVGPRVVPLEFMMAWRTTSARHVASYSRRIRLTDEEWERLPGIAWSRRLVNLTFRLCLHPDTAGTVTGKISAARRECAELIKVARTGAP